MVVVGRASADAAVSIPVLPPDGLAVPRVFRNFGVLSIAVEIAADGKTRRGPVTYLLRA